jgi:hypothetical protein
MLATVCTVLDYTNNKHVVAHVFLAVETPLEASLVEATLHFQ